jgi:hypothetical protein
MPRSTPRQPSLPDELQQLEAALASLTLRVAQLRRHQAAGRANNGPPPSNGDENGQELRIGDQVIFTLIGQHTTGVVISFTTHRIRIRQHRTNHIFLRAPRNVVRLTTRHHVGARDHTTATGGHQ